ncbi:MAG: hypothetical protein ACYTGQ_06115, partial [Planctomycetota bacterium]
MPFKSRTARMIAVMAVASLPLASASRAQIKNPLPVPDLDAIRATEALKEAEAKKRRESLEPTPEQIQQLNRLQAMLDAPTTGATPETHPGARLIDISEAALALETQDPPAPLKLRVISVRMQALYLHATQFPNDPQADRRLASLKIAARQAKTIDEPTAPALGDFWLLMADLHDINRSGLPLDARRAQARDLLANYHAKYKTAPTLVAIRQAMRQIDNPPTPKPDATNTPEAPATPDPSTVTSAPNTPSPNQAVTIET